MKLFLDVCEGNAGVGERYLPESCFEYVVSEALNQGVGLVSFERLGIGFNNLLGVCVCVGRMWCGNFIRYIL